MKNRLDRHKVYYDLFGRNIQRLDDIHSYPLVKEYLPSKSYFPITGSSLGYHALATIINDITINGRKSIIEFGSGLSTLVLAKYAEKYGVKLKIISVEHDRVYLSILKDILHAENLISYVSFIESDLTDQNVDGNSQKWYSRKVLNAELGNERMDMVVIDGPISDESNRLGRYSAIDFMSTRLSPHHSIYLDDIHRRGESAIIDLSLKNYGIRFRKISQTLALAHSGDFFNPVP